MWAYINAISAILHVEVLSEQIHEYKLRQATCYNPQKDHTENLYPLSCTCIRHQFRYLSVI